MTIPANVRFTGDARDLTRASREAERAVSGVGRSVSGTGKELRILGASAEAPRKRLVSMANATQLAFGAAGLAYGIKQSVDAFKEAEIQAARVAASLQTLGVNNAAARKQVEEVTLAQQRLSGFQDDELQRSFSTIVRVTHDVNESLRLNALAMDISRASGKDLNAVASAIARVADGNVNALSRYGVKAEKGATATDVFRKAQERFAGQAAAYGKTVAGQAEIASSEFNNLQEKIGGAFGPVLNQAAGGILSFTSAVDSLSSSVGGFGTVMVAGTGFGAVQLAAPVLGKFGGVLGKVSAGFREGGGGVAGFGKALTSAISPLGLVSIGAGVAAAGIYEVWKNSENAEQAVRGFGNALEGLSGAQDQSRTATENLKLSRITARKADEALAAQQKQNRGLHAQVVADNRAEAHAVDVATEAKRKHGANSKQYTQAYRDATAATSKADGTNKAYEKGLKATGDLATYASIAHGRLKSAQDNVTRSAGGVATAQEQVDRKTRDVISKAQAAAQRIDDMAHSARGAVSGLKAHGNAAAEFARIMDKGAASTDKSQVAAIKTEKALASLARQIGRVPSQKEIRIVQRYVAQGLTLDQIKRKMDSITSKVVTLTTRQVGQPFSPRNPVNPTQAPAATGATIAGSFDGVDDTAVLVGSGERILNARQVAMVDAGIPVDVALALTGAPTITPGGAFQTGGVPIKTRLSQAGLTPPGRVPAKLKTTSSSSGSRSSGTRKAAAPVDKRPAWLKHWEDDLGSKLPGEDGYDQSITRLEADLADAGRTGARADDVRATHRLIKASRARLDTLHGPKLRGAHTDSGKWQSAVNSQISSVAGQLSGYRSGLTDLSARTSPDDITIQVPSGIRWRIERSTFTEGLGDDLAALQDKKRWIQAQLAKKGKGRITGAKRIAMQRELARTKHEINATTQSQTEAEAADAQQAADDAGQVPELPIGVQQALADAALTPSGADDWVALQWEEAAIRDQLADPRFQDPRVQVALKGSLASVLGEIRQLESGGAGEADAGPTGPTADQQAQTAQLQQRLDTATRTAALSEAELGAFRGSGDIGTGRFGNALGAGAGTAAMLTVLGDQRSLSTLAGAFVQGASSQPAVGANRSSIIV